MKKKITYTVGAMILLFSTACESLDTKPTDFIAPQFYYSNEEELTYALTGIYDIIGNPVLYGGGNALIGQFDCADGMYFTTGNGPGAFNYSAAENVVNQIWTALYQGIERTNLFLENVDNVDMDAERRNAMKGEAKFLRAFYHFVLVQNYGAVPLKTSSTTSVSDVYYSRTAADDVYEFVIREMEEAEALVNEITAHNHSSRITKSAVQGILARVCLYKAGFPNHDESRYSGALEWAKKVIASGYHELNPDYSNVFINLIQNRYDTKESIWEVEYYTTGAGEAWNETGGLGGNNGIAQNQQAYGFSGPQLRVQQYVYDLYERGEVDWPIDLRRDWAIAPYRYRDNNGPEKVFWEPDQIYDRYIGKYRREYELVENRIQNGNGTNSPLLRYADVLLMAAEAENELNGPTHQAQEWVNEVRRRGYAHGRVIRRIQVTNGGAGYVEVPQVAISGSSGQQAAGLEPTEAVAEIADGQVTAIHIRHNGTFYNGTPTVAISGGGGTGATAEVEMVQVTDADLPPAATADRESFRKAIREERLRELCFEGGFRRMDLIRWGIYVSYIQGEFGEFVDSTVPSSSRTNAMRAVVNISEKHNYVPIPLRELSLNTELYQNPGW